MFQVQEDIRGISWIRQMIYGAGLRACLYFTQNIKYGSRGLIY